MRDPVPVSGGLWFGVWNALIPSIGAWWLIASYWPDSFLVILAMLMLLGGLSIPHRRG